MSQRQCPVCADTFAGERGVRKHAWAVHDACHLCGDHFDDQDALYRHWLDDHAGAISTAAEKRAEAAVGELTVCPVCDERMGSADAVRDHAWDAHGACHRCGEQFDDASALHTHWLVTHPSELGREGRERARNDVGAPGFTDRLAHGGPAAAAGGMDISRRSVLTAGGVAAAGVLGYGAVTALRGNGSDTSRSTLAGHPATRGVSDQPTLGPAPGTTEGTIVAFEDPFCPACARFEQRNFPRLKREYVDPGRLSFVFRGVPLVTSYSSTGVHALEATYARSADAFWRLKARYFEHQHEITADNVETKTKRYLKSLDAVDAAAIMDDVERRRFGSTVEADRSAARDAGVRGTPTFFLFREGIFTTKVVGQQPASALASALDL